MSEPMLSLDDSINKLGLSTRPHRALVNYNIEKIGQLVAMQRRDLLNLHGLGELALSEIELKLEAHWFKLAEKPPRPIPKTRGKWQPKETAPKDGTLIFAYINLTPEQENMTLAPTIVYWSRSEELAEPCFVEPYSNRKLKAPLIYWMPLPEPPKQ